MCGRYGFSINDAKEVYERFDIYNELADLTARYNIAPGQMNPVITSHSPNQISRMFWGLIPYWAKDNVSVHLGYRAMRRAACPVRCQQGWESRMEQVPHRALPHRRL
jgi:putative SOS response-associated peptidase YedK